MYHPKGSSIRNGYTLQFCFRVEVILHCTTGEKNENHNRKRNQSALLLHLLTDLKLPISISLLSSALVSLMILSLAMMNATSLN